MLNKFGTSSKLYLLIFITATSLIGLGLYAIGDLKKMNDNTETLYSDRVLCIQQLLKIRFEYGTNILPMQQDVKNHTITFSAAKKRILNAQAIIDTAWHNYKRTYLTPEEWLLVKQTELVKKSADKETQDLLYILSKEDTLGVARLIQSITSTRTAPFTLKINQLIDLQVQVAKQILNKNKTLYRVTSANLILFILLSLLIALSLSFYIIKNIKDLIKDILNGSNNVKKSEEKYRMLIGHASDAIYILDAPGNFVDVNESMCKMTGYSKEELLQLKIDDIVDPEQLKTDPLKRGYDHLSQSVFRERRFIRKDGKIFDVEINVNKFADDQVLVMARDITERKQAQELILREKALSESIVNSLPGIFYLQSATGEYLFWNKSFETVTGYTKEEIAKLRTSDLIDENDFGRVMDTVKKLYTEGYATVEAKAKMKDGTRIPFLLTGTPIMYEGKLCLLGTGIDISSRIKAEELILKEKALSETVINSLPGMFYLRNEKGKLVRWNKNLELATGYSGQEIESLTVREMIDSEDHEIMNLAAEKVFKEGYATAEVRIVSKAGIRTPYLLTGSPINYENQLCLLGTGIDISSRIKAEELLKKSEANLKTIMDTTDTAYTLLDKELNVMAYNQMAVKFVNSQFNHNPAKGDKLADYFPKERFPQFLNYTQQVLQGESINYEVSYPQPDGSALWYYVKLFPITNDQDEIFGLMLALSDITDHKIAEIHLEELNENLKKHAKELAISNAELEQFAYVASHDLQEPLRMVTSFMTQLEKKYGDVVDDKGRQYIRFAVDGAKRMRQIILDLLDFSRVGNTEDDMEDVNFNKLMNEIQALYRRQIEESHAKITFENLPTLHIYKTPIRQVFQNLVGNSLKYHRKGVAPVIEIACKEAKTHYQFSVKDNGIGIAPEFFDKIFIIFQRLHNKDEYSGTGMGLAITKKIVESLGGKIWLESEEGKGSTFYFTLLKK